MNKIRLVIQISVGLLTVVCVGCNWIIPEKKIELQYLRSPNGEREAVLKKSESNNTYLTVKYKDKTIDKGYPIYLETNWDGDVLTDFISRYPVRKWINEQVFLVGYNEDYKSSEDKILVKNLSSKTIEQIQIDSFGMYFIYEIQSNEVVEIPVTWSKDNSLPRNIRCDISAEVNFSDGTRIPLKLKYLDNLFEDKSQTPCGSGVVNVSDKEISF